MTLLYFKRKIDEELEGAKEYINEAISLKSTRPVWAKTFADMSEIELGHARRLLEMFHSYYGEVFKDGASEQMEEVREDMLEEYTNKYTCVLKMHDIYKM